MVPADKKKQDVWTKKKTWIKKMTKAEKDDKIEKIKRTAKKDLKINDKQFGKKAGYHMQEFNLKES